MGLSGFPLTDFFEKTDILAHSSDLITHHPTLSLCSTAVLCQNAVGKNSIKECFDFGSKLLTALIYYTYTWEGEKVQQLLSFPILLSVLLACGDNDKAL